jgi:3',5'-cyclic AMP phosphodiesterase CpdA
VRSGGANSLPLALALILHLSDLHLLANPREQESIFDGLVEALRDVQERAKRPVDLLAITGDVFDSATAEPKLATTRFLDLFTAVGRSLGGEPPTVILPGNHDRRRGGLFGPHRESLFFALKRALGARAWVHGCTTPFLSAVLPRAFHGQRFSVIAYDSTYLPQGLLSAGGALRQEDLLSAAAQIGSSDPDDPVLFLLHHHLVPTPITDLGAIEVTDEASPILRWAIERALPELVAHGDREELTMTALGAGTALSTLHTLGRAVLVLHGHKHYATARLLNGTRSGHGDVLVVSAGSAGIAQRWSHVESQNAARLWPSFNVISWDERELAIDTVSFPWKGGASTLSIKPLVRATRSGYEWQSERLGGREFAEKDPDLDVNESIVHLAHSAAWQGRFDYECVRTLRAHDGLLRYLEAVEGARGGHCVAEPFGAVLALPAELHLDVRGTTRYEVRGGIFRTLVAAHSVDGHRAPAFAHIGLMSRYASRYTRLEVSGLGMLAARAFASTTDLGTGLEQPLGLTRAGDADSVVAAQSDCLARTLIRIYWPLE